MFVFFTSLGKIPILWIDLTKGQDPLFLQDKGSLRGEEPPWCRRGSWFRRRASPFSRDLAHTTGLTEETASQASGLPRTW